MSKYKPLSKNFLLSRGKCCHSGCFNCPYKKAEEMKEVNGLKYKKPFRSELELEIYNLFSQIPNLVDFTGNVDMTTMTGMEKKELIEKIHKKYNIQRKQKFDN